MVLKAWDIQARLHLETFYAPLELHHFKTDTPMIRAYAYRVRWLVVAIFAVTTASCEETNTYSPYSPEDIRADDLSAGLGGLLLTQTLPAKLNPSGELKALKDMPLKASAEDTEKPEPARLSTALLDRALSCAASTLDLQTLQSECAKHDACNASQVGYTDKAFSIDSDAVALPAGTQEAAWYVMVTADESSGSMPGCAVKPKRCGMGGCDYYVLGVTSDVKLKSTDGRSWSQKRVKLGPSSTTKRGHRDIVSALKDGVPMCFGTANDGPAGTKLQRFLSRAEVSSMELNFKEDRAWMSGGGVDWSDRFKPACKVNIEQIVRVSR